MSWERIGTARLADGKTYDYYQLKDDKKGYTREVVRVVHDDKLGASEKQKPQKSESLNVPAAGELPKDIEDLPDDVEKSFRRKVEASEYNPNAVPANAYSPPHPSAPVDPSKPTENVETARKKRDLMKPLTEAFGGGKEGEKRAKAYLENPPKRMSEEAWINQAYAKFYTEGGSLKPEDERPDQAKLNSELKSNLKFQIEAFQVSREDIAPEKAGEYTKALTVEGDDESTLQNFMATRDRQTTWESQRASAMTPVSEAGLGWDEDKWHSWAVGKKYETPAGRPNRELDPAQMKAELQKERVLVVDEARLKGYVEKVYGSDKGSAEAYMASAPKGTAERQAWVNKELAKFETDDKPPKVKANWPAKEDLNKVSIERSKERAQKALEEIYGRGNPRVTQELVKEKFVEDPLMPIIDPLKPEQASKAADRFEALAEAKRYYKEKNPGKTDEDFIGYAENKGWITGEGNVSPTMEAKSITDDTARQKAYDNFRRRLIDDGYSAEQADFILRNTRVPEFSDGAPLEKSSPAEIKAAERRFFLRPKEARDKDILEKAQNNLVRDYAEKMKISPEAARVHLLSEGVLRKSATWEQVNAKQKHVAGLDEKKFPDTYKAEADAIKATTGATPQNKNGDAAKIQKTKDKIDPADMQYQDQQALADKNTKSQMLLQQQRFTHEIELQNLKDENAMKQLERRAEHDKELEGIRHENAMKLEGFRQRMENARALIKLFADFMQGMIQTYAQAANADKQMLGQITAASINRMQQG